MDNLKDFTLKQVSEYIIRNIASDREISIKLARKLFINALSYFVVIEAIEEQIDFLIGEELDSIELDSQETKGG